MKNIKLFLIAFSIILFSCNTDDSSAKEDEMSVLTEMYNAIVADSKINNTPCTNPDEWSFIAIGTKACGGTAAFIPYSLKINVPDFVKKVENYTNAQTAFDKKWGIMSTCDIILPPTGVDCVDGKPTLIYSITN